MRQVRPDGRLRIVSATSGRRIDEARALVEEYAASLPINLRFQGFRQEMAGFPDKYGPPRGALLLAYAGRVPAGVVGLRSHGTRTCEMKRLYVRTQFRGRGLGRALSTGIVRRAEALGYARMRLDTLPSMVAAIALYEGLGFRRIPAYRFNPVPDAVFLELVLRPSRPQPGRARVRRKSARSGGTRGYRLRGRRSAQLGG